MGMRSIEEARVFADAQQCYCGMRAKRSNNRLRFSSHAKVRSTRIHSACIAVWMEKAW
jgi:hypothetical protein